MAGWVVLTVFGLALAAATLDILEREPRPGRRRLLYAPLILLGTLLVALLAGIVINLHG